MALFRLFLLLPILCAAVPGSDRFPRMADFADREALLEAYVEVLHPLDFDYRQVGSVLEGLALTKFEREFFPAPEHRILSGVQYFSREGRTIGELDLVVWSNREQRVLEVYEVKLSSNHARAGTQADQQIKRFQNALRRRQVDRISTRVGEKRDLAARHFDGRITYGIIGARGSTSAGWAYEIDLTREEGNRLQRMLLER